MEIEPTNTQIYRNPMMSRPWLNGRYYLVYYRGKTYKYHRLLMELSIGRPLSRNEHVDHIDGDRSNNSLSNLRIVSHSQNMMNQRRKSKGVKKVLSGWQARISLDKKCIYLGTFKNKILAIAAYNMASKKLHKEYGRPSYG